MISSLGTVEPEEGSSAAGELLWSLMRPADWYQHFLARREAGERGKGSRGERRKRGGYKRKGASSRKWPLFLETRSGKEDPGAKSWSRRGLDHIAWPVYPGGEHTNQVCRTWKDGIPFSRQLVLLQRKPAEVDPRDPVAVSSQKEELLPTTNSPRLDWQNLHVGSGGRKKFRMPKLRTGVGEPLPPVAAESGVNC